MESLDPALLGQPAKKDPDKEDETNNYIKTQINQELKCTVCGDRASGIHYKVVSCDGCRLKFSCFYRGFFKRTVRKGIQEVCRNNNNCLVNKTTRTSCKPCRFKKCIDTGMDRAAVQMSKNNCINSDQKLVPIGSGAFRAYIEKLDQICKCFNDRSIDCCRESIVLNCSKIDGNEVSLCPDSNLNKCGSVSDWTIIAKHSFRLMLKWVVHLNYLKNMNEMDRCLILEDNWPLLFVLTLCQFYESSHIMKLIHMLYLSHYHKDSQPQGSQTELQKTSSRANETGTYDTVPLLHRIRDVTLHLQYLHCDNEEFALMKTMALHYPSSEELKSWGSIAGNYKSAAINFINYICKRTFPPDSLYDYSNKISTVMMLLASIKGFSSKKMELTFSPALDLIQPIDRIFWNSLFINNNR